MSPQLLPLLVGALLAFCGCQAEDKSCPPISIYSQEDFNRELADNKLVVAGYFNGDHESKKDEQYFDGLCKPYPGIKFLKINSVKAADVAQNNNVKDVSTYQIFKDHVKVSEIVGSSRGTELEDILKRL